MGDRDERKIITKGSFVNLDSGNMAVYCTILSTSVNR